MPTIAKCYRFLKAPFRKLLFWSSAFFCAFTANAWGTQIFPNIRSLMGAPYYRVVCAHNDGEMETRVFVSINEGWVKAFKVDFMTPSESVQTVEAIGWDLAGFTASLGFTQLEIKGSWPGIDFNQEMSLVVRDGQSGMEGQFDFDDGEGFVTTLDMRCRATNLIRFD